jgi:hypothetical protein
MFPQTSHLRRLRQVHVVAHVAMTVIGFIALCAHVLSHR